MLDMYIHGERYTENLGAVSRTVATEIRNKRRGDISAGELAVNGKLWKNKRWLAVVKEQSEIEDLSFDVALTKYLEWYKANRGAYISQIRYARQ